MADRPLHPWSHLAHAGLGDDPQTRAIVPALHTSTTYVRDADGAYPQGYAYIRERNPTRALLEAELMRLEHGHSAQTYASGNAAVAALFFALQPGNHVILPREVYHGVRRLVLEVLQPWGLQVTVVPMADLAAVQAALRPHTKLIWVETPSNPALSITDIRGVVALAQTVGATVACDNTFATPLLTQPLALGADVVMHSLTKYLNGHSDVLGGALVFRDDTALAQRARSLQTLVGGVLSPQDAWLVLRGLRSLGSRLRTHCENAQALATWLAQHPQIAAVLYPGLPSHPQHALAATQMCGGFGGMLSIRVRGGAATAMAVAAACQTIVRATSLGGTETLIEHRASVEGPDTPTPPDLLRLSVGLEHLDDLIADLTQALAGV